MVTSGSKTLLTNNNRKKLGKLRTCVAISDFVLIHFTPPAKSQEAYCPRVEASNNIWLCTWVRCLASVMSIKDTNNFNASRFITGLNNSGKKDSLSGHSDTLLHSSSLIVWNHDVSAGLITAASALAAAVSWAPQWQMGEAADQRLPTKTLLFTSCTHVTSLSFWWNTKHKFDDFSKALKFDPLKYLWKNQNDLGLVKGMWHRSSSPAKWMS